MHEATPVISPDLSNVQARVVSYTTSRGTAVTQQRYYAATDNGLRQVKRADVVGQMSAYLIPETTAEASVTPLDLVAASAVTTDVAPSPVIAAVEATTTAPVEADSVRSTIPATVGTLAVRASGMFGRAAEKVSGLFENVRNGFGKKAAALLLVSTVALVACSDSGNGSSAERPGQGTTTPTTAVEGTAPARPDQAKLQEVYGNRINGDRDIHQIGAFDVDPSNPEASQENFYSEIRHNPDALAFWDACLGTKAPGYNSCVADASVLEKANDMAVKYRDMELSNKAAIADKIVDQFKHAKFDGITTVNGTYKTVGIDAEGKYFATTASRQGDARLNYTFTIDGKTFKVQLRACDQITEQEAPAPAPAPVVPVAPAPSTPNSTVTSAPNTSTSTSTSSTSTTIQPTTTSTSTTIRPTTSSSTSTTVRPTTSTSSTSTSSTSTTIQPTTSTSSTVVPKHDDGDPGAGDSPVPADHGPGAGDIWGAGSAPAVPGVSPANVPRQPQVIVDPIANTPPAPSSETQHRPPAVTGPEPVNPLPPAIVPGTNNNVGQGGPVDPNSL